MAGQIDKIAVNEVILFAENDSFCYQHLIQDYLANLQKKVLKGIYDHKLAIKLLEYFYSNYVRPQIKKPSLYGWDPKLNPDERKMFAEHFVKYLEVEFLNELKKQKPTKKAKPKTSIKALKARRADIATKVK
jgi:hypothetical protein